MSLQIDRSTDRGFANHGWLKARHSFSFASYYNPERLHFGALRVLNDDLIAPESGFGTHGHQNMEIISVPLAGELSHKDNTGQAGVIQHGDVQVMSAGSGIQHSEFNDSKDVTCNLLQIWVVPDRMDVSPRYAQKNFELEKTSQPMGQYC